MTIEDLRKLALGAIGHHERTYDVKVPKRLRDFYASTFTDHHCKFVEPEEIPDGYGESVGFELELVPPTWEDKDDDAINGPDGEWEAAKHFLPIFVTNGQTWLVVDLRTPECAVGWYAEESFRNDDDGYKDGVLRAASSLDDFLKTLKTSSAKEDVFRAEEEYKHEFSFFKYAPNFDEGAGDDD